VPCLYHIEPAWFLLFRHFNASNQLFYYISAVFFLGVQMLKKLFMLFILLVFAGFVSAEVQLLYPVASMVNSGDTVQLGSV